jgi:hypothetical protein
LSQGAEVSDETWTFGNGASVRTRADAFRQ